MKCGAPVSDITAGILGAMGCLSAYTHRLKTGEGQRVDTSLFEAGITQTYWQSAIAFATGQAPEPMGSAHPLNAPYESFETADRWINVGGANQRNWLRVLDVIGAPELAEDPRFRVNEDRLNNRVVLAEVLAPYFRAQPAEHWLTALADVGVPAGPVLDVSEMHAHPQTIAREMTPEFDHPIAGKVRTIGAPVKFSQTPGGVTRAAPVLGEHTREVLSEIGYSEENIAALLDQGAAI